MHLHGKNGVLTCVKNFNVHPYKHILFKIQSKLVWYYICIFAMDSVDLKMSYNVSLSLLRKYYDI